jgi:hypothetical protein
VPAQHGITFGIFEPLLRLSVNWPIHLHDQPRLEAHEVCNVAFDRRLPPKLPAIHSAVAKLAPEQILGRGLMAPQLLGKLRL